MSGTSAPRVRLEGRLIALGVTGSIAAYKAPELVRALQAEGAEVVALLTPSAARFVAPLALAALTRHAVEDDVLGLLPDGRIGHIVAADSADAILVAPATANWLAAMAAGLAGDVVTATVPGDVSSGRRGSGHGRRHVRAPGDPGQRRPPPGHLRLRDRRARERPARLRPDRHRPPGRRGRDRRGGRRGRLGTRAPLPGPGDPPAAAALPREADLAGRHIVITAGGTAEPIDPVRFITNRSTGKMGVAVAEAALDRGAHVTLIAGTVSVPLPDRATVINVGSTAQMRAALLVATVTADPDGRASFDALVMAAAVADFRPVRPAETKLTRGEGLTLELEPTPDLLAEVARIVRGQDAVAEQSRQAHTPAPLLVGFAAETGSLERAVDKLTRKGVDLLVANDVSEPGSGFGTETNRVTIFSADGPPDAWPLLTKREVADRLLDLVAARLDARDAARQTSGAPGQEIAEHGAHDVTERQPQETGR